MPEASTSNADNERSELERLAEEYVELYRQGRSPNIDDFVNDHPALANDIREYFPVVLMLDQGRSAPTESELAFGIRHNTGAIRAGSRLGDYLLLQTIGLGGMGVVYEAEHETLHNRVAIKLLPESLNRPKLRERFLREASAAAKMNHPNIVRVFGYGCEKETHYYVMSLIEGIGLNQLLSTQTFEDHSQRVNGQRQRDLATHGGNYAGTDLGSTVPMGGSTIEDSSELSEKPGSLWHWVAGLGLQAADALAYAHELGVIHRDVKPSNIMLDMRGKLYVTDFGLAKLTDDSSLTETGDMLGTLRYMPPEALQGKAGERGDIYGLGLTLYEMLAGEPAFANSDRGKLFYDISQGDIVPLLKRVPKVPHDLAQIVGKATEADPALRYASAAAMRDDLRRFLSGEPIEARPASLGYRAQRWVARNTAVSVLGGCLFVILVATAGLASLSARRFRDLAYEKQQETNAATSNARQAKVNLLRVQLSDTRGWATSSRVGQRTEGIKSLQAAISLARDLKLFDEYRDQILETAVTLSALHDAPVVAAWQDAKIGGSNATVSFNGDLSEYVLGDKRKGQDCLIYRVSGSTKELIEQIPLGHPCLERIRFSSDGTLICSWVDLGSERIALWVYDREMKKSYLLDEHSSKDRRLGLQIRDDLKQILYVNSSSKLAIFDTKSGNETTIDLPDSTHWQQIELSHDESQVAAYAVGKPEVVVVDLTNKTLEDVPHKGSGVRSIAWRQDGRHLAIGTTKILIWDFSRRKVCATLEQNNTYVNRLEYAKNGRLLFSSGWLSRTEVHDAMAERRIFRCESIVSDISDCGNYAAFFAGPNVRIRRVDASDSIFEFDYGRLHRERHAKLDCKTGLLWLAPHSKISAYDLPSNRPLSTKWLSRVNNFVAVDPAGRDVFLSADSRLYRMPITPLEGRPEKGSARVEAIRVGPPELLMKPHAHQRRTMNNIRLDSSGNRLGMDSASSSHATVFSREQGWEPILDRTSKLFPTKVAPHSRLPLIVTSSHSIVGCEVYDWETKSVVLTLPFKRAFADFSPDGRRLYVQAGGCLRVYEVGSWSLLATSDPRFSHGDNPPIVSNDNQWLALQTQDPRGIAILDAETLNEALFIRGRHLDPDSFVGSFDATGRFLVANRGQQVIAAWDLYKLREFFESLDLEWPLPGLGNPTPLRDPDVEVEVLWEPVDSEPPASESIPKPLATRLDIGRWGRDWLIAPDYYVQQAEDWTAFGSNKWTRRIGAYAVDQIHAVEKKWLPELSISDVSSSIQTAFRLGVPAFNAEDYQGCSEVYLQFLNQLRSRRIERGEAAIQSIVNETLDRARNAENIRSQDGKPWILRRGIDAILKVIHEPEIE